MTDYKKVTIEDANDIFFFVCFWTSEETEPENPFD